METNTSSYINLGKVVVLPGHQIQDLITMEEALAAVEHALKLESEGRVVMPPKLYLDLPKFVGDFRAMPAYINGTVGLKWVSVYPNNQGRNLPSVTGMIILNDPTNGYPLAIMDGTYITSLRTGAIGGVAVKYLARKDSSVIGMVGAGVQAESQLVAINKVLAVIKEVRVFDTSREASSRFAKKMRANLHLNIRSVKTIRDAAEADIVVTTTPSKTPIVKKKYIRPGTHINAIGADAKGKQELELGLLTSAKVIVDNIEQASHSGEINVAISQNLMRVEGIYATLGEIVTRDKIGRENDQEITIFDSTGLGLLDIACARLIYDKAKRRNVQVLEIF